MRIKSLRLQNFRSFRDSTVQFPEKGLVLIRGVDTETGESSGTGKTAIFLALSYVFDILPSPHTAKSLQNWDSDESLQVSLEIEKGGQSIWLHRGKKTVVEYPDRQISGAKSYPDALKELLGFGPEILTALTFRAQGAPGFFLSMPPAGKIEFLTQILGLGAIETAVENAQATIKSLEMKLSFAEQQRVRAEDRLKVAQAEPIPQAVDISRLHTAVSEAEAFCLQLRELATQAQVNLTEAIASARKARAGDIESKKATLQEARTLLGALKESEDKRAQDIRTEETQLRQSLQRLSTALSRLELQESQISRLSKDLAALEAGQCPTCERAWDQSTQKRLQLQGQLDSLRHEAQGKTVFESQKALVEKKLSESKYVPDARLEQLRKIELRLLADLTIAENIANPALSTLQEDLVAKNSRLQEATVLLRKVEADLREAQATAKGRDALVARRQAAIEAASAELQVATAECGGIQQQLGAEKDFVALLGREGFLGVIFEDVLTEISVEVNRRLGQLANVNRVGLSFSTETDKGKRQIQTWVDVRGHRAKFETGLSGGMQTSLEQVTDLAVMSVISARTGGAVPGWLLLDEVFEGQGRVTKEAALEVLREFAKDRLVLVIDHGTEFKEAFPAVIDIEFEGGRSRIC